MTHTSVLYLQLVAVSGLSSLFADRTVARACSRAGVDPMHLTSIELSRAIPAIEEALAVYLPPDELASAMTRIRGLLAPHAMADVRSLSMQDGDDEDEGGTTLPERVARALEPRPKPSE
ncbi:MAG TPA: hypothetical protein VF316_18245 [Polyangiaceae bacterium]